MSWVATAIVGSAVVGGVATYYATEESGKATEKAIASTEAQYQQTREDQEPWRIAGEKALQTIQDTPDFQFTAQDFEAMKDPGYQFRMEEGVNALDRSAASRGRLLSGAQDRAVTRYSQGLASQEYGNAFNRALTTNQANLGKQQSLAGIGQNALNITNQAGQQSTAAINALNMNQAQTTANMYGNLAQTANQGIGNYLLYSQTQPTAGA